MTVPAVEPGATPTEEENPAGTGAEPPAAEEVQNDGTEEIEGEADLGDKGKQALDRMKAERKAANEKAAAEKARADALQAKLDGREAEHAAEQEKANARAEALQVANQRILRSEIKAAAKGVLADPADAYRFLDMSQFEVSDDGDVDDEAIAAALKDLVESKPYLAVQDGAKRFQHTADGGPKGSAGNPQVTEAQLKTMTPDEIVKAQNEGRLEKLLGG